jgi:hypothetical protein
MRFLAGALVAAWAFASHANTLSTDYTDQWWNPDESGWGANVALQNDTMFITLFVYDNQGHPIWFVAPSMPVRVDGSYNGTLYQTTGPWYVTTYNPALVTTLAVGSATFTPSSFTTATLVYSVGGQTITKKIQRQSWKSDNLTGVYNGGREGTWSNCDAALGTKVSSPTVIGITHNGTDVIIRDAGKGYTCNYTGKVTMAGRFMQIVGDGVCDDNISRFLEATEVYASREGFTMRYRMEQIGTNCTFTGYIGGIRTVQ